MGTYFALEETARLHLPTAFEAGRLDSHLPLPTASRRQLLHLLPWLPRDPMPLPPPRGMTITTIPRLNGRLLLQNLDDFLNIITSHGRSRQQHPSLGFTTIAIHYDDLNPNNTIQMKYPLLTWKYALKLKLQQLKLKALTGVKKTQRSVRRSRSAPVILVQPQTPTAGHKTAHVPRSKRGSQKHKTVPVPKI